MQLLRNIWCKCFLNLKKKPINMTLRGQQTLEYSVKIKQNILEIFFFLNECFIYAFVKNFDQNKFLSKIFFNLFQWAKIVLVVEQSVSTEIRKEERLKYSHPSADGDRNFVVRWHQTVLNQWPCVLETRFSHLYHSILRRPS